MKSLRGENKVAPVTPDRTFNVLFLCTGNSARSIMAEVLLNHFGKGRFQAFSAGSHPRGSVHPLAIATLIRNHLPIEGLRSKSWDEFAAPGAPQLDFVFTVCDHAAKEICPIWPGQPMTADWGIEDPAAVEGTPDQQQRAFNLAFRALDARLRIFTSLRLESLDSLALQRKLDEIGRTPQSDAKAVMAGRADL
jgi:arsenate reductase (thioredoxin)